MANPSTTGPSGIGTEVLRRVGFTALDNATTSLLTVGTDMIVTILSMYISNLTSSTATLKIIVALDGSGLYEIYRGSSNFAEYTTFVLNDKIVLTETDVLKVYCTSTDHDIWISYIEQEFA